MNDYREVTINRTEYTLTQEAYLTSRLFYGSFNDRYEDKAYEIEYQASAIDPNGKEVEIRWQFPSTVYDTDFYNGDESNLPWDKYCEVIT